MSRIRTIKPEFFTDDKIGTLPFEVRLCFIGLWCLADDYGTLNLHPLAIKGQLFPFDSDLDIEKCLDLLEEKDLIVRYGPNKKFILIPNFQKHQHIPKPRKQRKAPPPEDFGINLDWPVSKIKEFIKNQENQEEQQYKEKQSSQNTNQNINQNINTSIQTDSKTETDKTEAGVIEGKENIKTTIKEKQNSDNLEKDKKENLKTKTEKEMNQKENKKTGSVIPLKKQPIPDCPYEEIKNVYNNILGDILLKCRKLSDSRKRKIKILWREILSNEDILSIMLPDHKVRKCSLKEKGLLWFERFFEYVAESDFLTGKVEPTGGRTKPFVADFEWLINQNNFLKVLEGRYHTKKQNPFDKLSPSGRKTAMAALNVFKKYCEQNVSEKKDSTFAESSM